MVPSFAGDSSDSMMNECDSRRSVGERSGGGGDAMLRCDNNRAIER